MNAFASPPSTLSPTANDEVTVIIQRLGDKLGLELREVQVGTSLEVIEIRSIVSGLRTSSAHRLQERMILRNFTNLKQLQTRLVEGPYPIELVFELPGQLIGKIPSSPGQTKTTTDNQYIVSTLSTPAAGDCLVQSQRGDVLEIDYEARWGGPEGPIYDTSAQRGTGQPYQMVLGSYDMIPGVDHGLVNMCPGEIRSLAIPSRLAYGQRGNSLFGVPPNSTLYWRVQLISINSIRAGDGRTREDMAPP